MSEASSDTAIKMNVLSTAYRALKGQTARNGNHYPSSIELVQVEFLLQQMQQPLQNYVNNFPKDTEVPTSPNRRLCVLGVSGKPKNLQKLPQQSSKTSRRAP